MNTRIIYEDQDVLVIHKPAGIATETARIGQADVVSELKNYRAQKKDDTYVGMIHRLDQPVEGLLLFAKNPIAAKKLTQDLNHGLLKKSYYALVQGVTQEEGRLEDYLLKNPKTNLSAVVSKDTPGAKYAALSFKRVQTVQIGEQQASLLEVWIETGRHHQIRCQMSHAGFALVGDQKYGNETTKRMAMTLRLRQTALLAAKLSYMHPKTGQPMSHEIPIPENWTN